MAKFVVVLILLSCSMSLVAARFRRNGEEVVKDPNRRSLSESNKHIYYVLLKPDQQHTQESTDGLCQEFAKRLGEDNKVRVLPASKDKVVIEIDGDDSFANKIVDAVKSFPESSWVERKPVFQTRGRRAVPTETANM